MMDEYQGWKTIPEPKKINHANFQNALSNELLQMILNIVQDGICILSTDLDILYANAAMEYWYGNDNTGENRKCYQVYHDRTEPCENCPALQAIRSGKPEAGAQILEQKGKKQGWQKLFCVPILNAEGEVYLVVEYIRDTTDEKKAMSSSDLMRQQNQFLREFMEQKDEESRKREQKIADNVNVLMNSMLDFVENLVDAENFMIVKKHLELAQTGLTKGSSPLIDKLSEKELAVAEYIKDGYVSKEIADQLNISKKTVDYHRANIRKKLKIGAKDSLQKYLKENL